MQLLPYSLFLDFGASFTKVAGLDKGNRTIFEFRVPSPELRSEFGFEFKGYDPKEYQAHAHYVYRKAIEEFGIPTDVAISGQVACYVLLNSMHEVILGVVSWQDTSSTNSEYGFEIESVLREVTDFEDGVRPGLPLLSMISNIRRRYKSIDDEIFYVNLTNYLLASLLGLSPMDIPIHISEAHASGMYSIRNDEWKTYALPADLRINLRFPKVTKKAGILANANSQISHWIPVGDQQAAAYGSEIKENEYLIHIATGGQVLCKLDNIPNINENEFQIRPDLEGDGYLATITHLPAGRLFNRLFDKLSIESDDVVDWKYLDSLSANDANPLQVPVDVKSINLGNTEFPQLSSFTGSPEKYLRSFAESVVNVYIESLNRLPRKQGGRYVLSGGLLTGSTFMTELFKSKLPADSQFRCLESDTSVLGLRKMVQNSPRLEA